MAQYLSDARTAVMSRTAEGRIAAMKKVQEVYLAEFRKLEKEQGAR
jgi:hypothetical protein